MHASDSGDRDSCFIHGTGIDDDGYARAIAARAWRYNDGAIFVEIRRLLDAFFLGTHVKWETARIIDKNFDHVLHYFEKFDVQKWEEIRPSRKSYEATHKAFGMTDAYVREEFFHRCSRCSHMALLLGQHAAHTEGQVCQ